MRAQMNPHFIFNALNSIQRYILSNEADEAYDYLGKFSVLMRKILVQSRLGAVPLADELDLLKDYLELEQLRVEHRITFRIEVEDQLDLRDTMIPPLLLQPILENAIWHGIQPAERAGLILLQVRGVSENRLEIVIEDNGVGRTHAETLRSEYRKKGTSTGLSNTKSRVTLLGYLEEMNAEFEIEDCLSEQGEICGTRVMIRLPRDWSQQTHVFLTETMHQN
jgi:LytS/YehU family sensor histidine kinase